MTTTIGRTLFLICVLTCAPAMATEMAARDARTGAPVTASVTLVDATGEQVVTVTGRLTELTAPPGRHRAVARAPGYQPLRFYLTADSLPTTLLLEPVTQPPAFARLEKRARQLGDAQARWLQGYVREAASGEAVADARLRVAGRTVHTDAAGYFELRLPPCASGQTRGHLRVDSARLGSQQHADMACAPGIQRLLVALGPDAPAVISHRIGALDRAPADLTGRLAELAADAGRAAPLPRPAAATGALLAPGLAPPASIRVGFDDTAGTASCCVGSCSHIVTMGLETYVRRGLNDEWINGWNQASLRAGSIAYRSYGAHHVYHPRSSYDICSSACCQVNQADAYANTDAAVARTAGIMLTYDGSEPARSEYSAENNSWDNPSDGLNCSNGDLSCGDGYAGSPGTGWPCLADSVGAGHGCFGHGRGMSQWGTKRWGDQGERWPWIVDHYYNDDGTGTGMRTAVMTSPLSLDSIAPQPATLEPGEGFQIHATAHNSAGATHAHLMVGASLYRSGHGYIDDSAHDAAAAVTPGSQAISRTFEVPAGTSAGRWDLLVSLYLDVDENGAISGTDLPLALVSVPEAVQVIGDRIFASGFEGL